jgi:ribonuclease P protein component
MIARKHRFTRKNFEFLRKRMKSFRTKNFLFLFGKSHKNSLFATVISKKTDNSAVKRNQFRRRTYELLRTKFNNYLTTNSLNLICLYKGTEIPKNSDEIYQEITKFFEFFEKKGKTLLIKVTKKSKTKK